MEPTSNGSTAAWPSVATSPALLESIKEARVLMVGAGGIGCELLKTLVLTGFENITLIDMDTIETSNLNRQFLFRQRHVGQSKAKVAAEAVKRFRPAANITAHQANVKESRFGVDFFRGFALVLNGLDNTEARRHVNRLCQAAEVPLVESGTEGYVGQVTVHLKGRTECYECRPKPPPKSFPVCTIRNTPDKPIHCVVWAKELLFQRLFGRPDVVTDLDEETAEEKAAGERDDPSFFHRAEGEAAEPYARRVFQRVFCDDIQRVLRMDELWASRSRPTPLHAAELLDVQPSAPASEASAAPSGTAQANGTAGHDRDQHASRALGLTEVHKLWSLQDQARVFVEAVRQYLEERPDEVGAAAFDKEDALAVDFVMAASNLRAAAYGIPMQTWFAAKGMAGNIIHAIATTNAIIAGLITVVAMQMLAGCSDICKDAFLGRAPRLVTTMKPEPPNPACMVCGRTQLQLHINTRTTTLGQLVDKVLKRRLALLEPNLNTAAFAYEEGEGLEPDEVAENAAHLPTTLAALPGGGIGHGSSFQVTDQAQEMDLHFYVVHQEDFDEEDNPDGFTLLGSVPAAAEPSAAGPSGGASTAAAPAAPDEDSDDDDIMLMSDGDADEDDLQIVGEEPAIAGEGVANGVQAATTSAAASVAEGSDASAAAQQPGAANASVASAATAAVADAVPGLAKRKREDDGDEAAAVKRQALAFDGADGNPPGLD